jgi:hypothetical protein
MITEKRKLWRCRHHTHAPQDKTNLNRITQQLTKNLRFSRQWLWRMVSSGLVLTRATRHNNPEDTILQLTKKIRALRNSSINKFLIDSKVGSCPIQDQMNCLNSVWMTTKTQFHW